MYVHEQSNLNEICKITVKLNGLWTAGLRTHLLRAHVRKGSCPFSPFQQLHVIVIFCCGHEAKVSNLYCSLTVEHYVQRLKQRNKKVIKTKLVEVEKTGVETIFNSGLSLLAKTSLCRFCLNYDRIVVMTGSEWERERGTVMDQSQNVMINLKNNRTINQPSK